MPIMPLNDWAVIVPAEAAERTAGGLYIPDAAKEKPAEGTVESIGPGALEEEGYGKKKKEKKDRKFIATTVKAGERVLYERYAGTKITIDGRDRVLVRERSILGIFAGNPGTAEKPLLLPSRTSSADASLAKVAMTAITAHAPVQPVKTAEGGAPAAKKTSSRKTAKKPAIKKSAKKPAAKKTAKKPAGKAASGKATKKKR